jgi:putative FmdB family regulatory protein
MPIYSYHCHNCQHADDEYQKLDSPALTECPKCQTPNYHRVPTLAHTDLREFHTPIEMYSIGLNTDEEIREFQKRCPDVEVCRDPASDLYGIPIARNRAQKKAALKAVGFEEKN